MEREEVRKVPEATEKQKPEHVLSPLIDMVWSLFSWNHALARALTTVPPNGEGNSSLTPSQSFSTSWFMCCCGKRVQGLECQFDTITSPRPASVQTGKDLEKLLPSKLVFCSVAVLGRVGPQEFCSGFSVQRGCTPHLAQTFVSHHNVVP